MAEIRPCQALARAFARAAPAVAPKSLSRRGLMKAAGGCEGDVDLTLALRCCPRDLHLGSSVSVPRRTWTSTLRSPVTNARRLDFRWD
jgi:hypothetical protein